jgi:hypothetical protein
MYDDGWSQWADLGKLPEHPLLHCTTTPSPRRRFLFASCRNGAATAPGAETRHPLAGSVRYLKDGAVLTHPWRLERTLESELHWLQAAPV